MTASPRASAKGPSGLEGAVPLASRTAALAPPLAKVPERPAPAVVLPGSRVWAPCKSGIPPPQATASRAAPANLRTLLLSEARRIFVGKSPLLEVFFVGGKLECPFEEKGLGLGGSRF